MGAKANQTFYVYILAGKSAVLYTGMTNNLARRLREHKEKRISGFTQMYNVTKLLWFELRGTAKSAIAREKEIKAWRRSKKVALIQQANPHWLDLSNQI